MLVEKYTAAKHMHRGNAVIESLEPWSNKFPVIKYSDYAPYIGDASVSRVSHKDVPSVFTTPATSLAA